MISMVVILALIWLVGMARISPVEVTVSSSNRDAIYDVAGSMDVVGGRPKWDLLQLGLVILALMFVVAVVAAWLMNRRIFRRIDHIIAVAHALDEANLNARFETTTHNDEVDQMAEAINDALDRLQSGFERQRMFVRAASHELRTPLTVARTALEIPLVEGRVPADLSQDLQDALSAQQQLETLLDTLLMLSRGESGTTQTLRLDDVIRRCVAKVQQQFDTPEIEWRLNLEPVTASISQVVFEIIVTNLLTNAVTHNHEHGWCEVSLSLPNDHILITIMNSGQSVDAEMVEQLSRPFVRREGSPGSGLGLTVVEQMLASIGGHMQISPRAEGGLQVLVDISALDAMTARPIEAERGGEET